MILKNEQYQPRFEAYIMHHGLNVGDEVKMYDFTCWITKKWSEWFEITDTEQRIQIPDYMHELFTNWLLETRPNN